MTTLEVTLPKELHLSIEFIKNELKTLKENYQPKEPKKYITRTEVSEMLSVDISTVHNMCKRKILQKYQISGRILFLRSEVEESIIKLA
jgi:hypothetical protein